MELRAWGYSRQNLQKNQSTGESVAHTFDFLQIFEVETIEKVEIEKNELEGILKK